MDLSGLVAACEETGGGEEEVAALVTFCETRLGSPVSQEMVISLNIFHPKYLKNIFNDQVRALANTARTETGRQRIRDSSLVQSIGAADWECRDHNTTIEVGNHH